MERFLPLFPLKLAVFPGEKIKLHIFEPRYKQLINECRQEGTPFGLPPYVDGRVAEFGTEMRLIHVFKVYDDGEMDILAEGTQAFCLREFVKSLPDKLYSGGHVTMIEDDPSTILETTQRLALRFRRFHELLESGYTRDNFEVRDLSFQVAQEVGLTLEQKVGLLGEPKETNRQAMLLQHLDVVIPVLEAARETRQRTRGNGHFKRLPPLDL